MMLRAVVFVAAVCAVPLTARAADWPMSHYDAQRSAASPQELPLELHLQWVRQLPALNTAWPDQPKMQFDAAYDPIIVGKLLYFGSSWTDSVTALDTDSGLEKWRFQADGPIRFAPAAWQGKLYVASDDGFLYCLDAAKGTVNWKFRGGPADRRLLGNERLISAWPARGAPVVEGGIVYFAASIWPFMGIFIHALEAETGRVVWTNDGDGAIYMKQPHNTDSFASVAPQGALTVAGDALLIPGGRSVPAVYDRKTGKMLRYQLAENGKRGGGSEVSAMGKLFFNGGAAFEVATEKWLGDYGRQVALTPDVAYIHNKGTVRAYDLKTAGTRTMETKDKSGKVQKTTKWVMDELTAFKMPAVEVLIKAGSRLYGGGDKKILAVELPLPDENGKEAEKLPGVTWHEAIEGTVARLAAADGKLFAVTLQGRIYCFGGKEVAQPTIHAPNTPPVAAEDDWTRRAAVILESTKVRDGWAVVWGVGKGRLVEELIRQSNLQLIVIDPDEAKVRALRDRLIAAGHYGTRAAVHVGEPATFPLPLYLASLMVAEDLEVFGAELRPATLKTVYAALRPYGGIAWLPLPDAQQLGFEKLVASAELVNAKTQPAAAGGAFLLTREGALPGSANWTHEHADAANTRVSRDQLVKAPLGILWFGGPSNDGILPRHGHGPQPQVIDGRLFIEGVDMMRCMDIYTGRILWETKLPGVGALYNNLAHQPGANATGTNFISTPDGVYVAYGKHCLRLDPATGKELARFPMPRVGDMKETSLWGYLNVTGDYLIGGADPWYDPRQFKPTLDPKLGDDDKKEEKKPEEKKAQEKQPESPFGKFLATISGALNDNMISSRHLVVMDRHTGKVRWSAAARIAFRHNGVCVGGGRIYAVDCYSGAELLRIKKRGETPAHKPRLVVFDLETGKELWTTEEEVFGTFLSYSEKHDVVVESGRVARDSLADEPKGMRAYRGGTGEVLWTQKSYLGPAMIHGDTILKDTSACDLLTGKPKMRPDPLTGVPTEWKWQRNYGCNTPAASEHLLTFRSGAAGYFDLCHDGGTGNWGGFRSSCTNNLIVAGGILTAPDYTRTCTCSYQNQTSLALVHMADVEMWTSFGSSPVRDWVRHVGLNFGAPGDRRAPDGTLWLEYPSVGGASPFMPLRTAGAKLEYFRRHSSQVQGDLPWVGASGIKGLSSLVISRGVDPVLLHAGHILGQAFSPVPQGPALWPTALAQTGLSALPPPKVEKTPVERLYTVRLHFAEPDGLKAGQRPFSIAIQGQTVLADFDIAREAGGPGRCVVKEFKGVKIAKELTLTFTPSPGAEVKVPLICGLELLAEGW
ncbi:MAG: PQQ-binding-like beta-propeller repeat protein [Planctomycetia bacterium]|nr:PQQ-binding-like beta-propeller repeat protein [Planctomycetia bacterium]